MSKLFTGGPPVWDFEYQGIVAVGAPVSIETSTVFLVGMNAVNTDPNILGQLTITDGADFPTSTREEIGANGRLTPPEIPYKKMTNGVKLGAAGSALIKIHLWGTRGV